MQNKFKKGISIVLAVLMLMASVPLAGFIGIEWPTITADAETQGDFEYYVSNGKATITDYSGTATELIIPSELGGYPVTSIGSSSFCLCGSLTSITIPSSVTTIGDSAFSYCRGLTSITILDNVTSIGDDAFSNCKSLTLISMPDSVMSIGDNAFSNCESLTLISIPDSVMSIGDNAFSNCESLTSVHISDIAAWCGIDFADYDSNPLSCAKNLYLSGELVTDLVIPNGVMSIGDYVFRACESLTSITIPDNVMSIGEWAFHFCESLISITILNPVCIIYDNTYAIPETATIYGYENSTAQAYAQKYNRTFVSFGTAPGNNITDGDLPAEYGNASVALKTDWHIDENGKFFVDLYMDNSVGMTSWMFDLDFDSDIISFVDYEDGAAIAECNETKSNSLTVEVCETQSQEGLLELGGYMKRVMWTAEDFAADARTNKDANVNPYHCHFLRLYFTVNDPNSYRTAQVEITASGTVDYAGECDNNPKYPAFAAKQTSATIRGNIVPTTVDSGICGNNLTWTLDSTGLLTISGTGDMYDYGDDPNPWEDYTSLIQTIVITDGVTSIGDYAFCSCESLTTITIPDGVISIGAAAFNSCESLVNITIPNSVSAIGDYAFCSCDSLTSITILNPDCDIYDYSQTIYNTATIYGYKNSTAQAYAQKYNRNFVALDEDTPTEPEHKHTYTAVVTAPTCETTGYTVFYCSCGDSYIGDFIDPLGHDYESKVTRPASHILEGERLHTCLTCGNTKTESIAKISEHNYKQTVHAPTCTSTGFTVFVCACGDSYVADYIDARDHTKETIPAVSSTCTKTGLTAGVKCTVCGKILTKQTETPAKGHDYKSVVTAPTLLEQGYTTHTCACGDSYKDAHTDPLKSDTAVVQKGAIVGLVDTSVQTILQQAGAQTKLVDATGNTKKDDAKIGTGDKLVLANGEEIVIVVLGDINGDGEIATSDARLALRKAVNLETFSDAQSVAARVDGGENVDVAHARKILRASVNLENPKDWFGALTK